MSLSSIDRDGRILELLWHMLHVGDATTEILESGVFTKILDHYEAVQCAYKDVSTAALSARMLSPWLRLAGLGMCFDLREIYKSGVIPHTAYQNGCWIKYRKGIFIVLSSFHLWTSCSTGVHKEVCGHGGESAVGHPLVAPVL